MECEVTGSRQHSPLVQGGLEIPFHLTLSGKKKLVDKAATLIDKKNQCS